jgi:prepilin-type processing-associated H-X9-DG protein
MEVLVVIAIILVIAVLTFPLVERAKQKKCELEALSRMRDLATAVSAYCASNNDELPREDAKGTDTWPAAADPENSDAWYNALPRLLNKRNVQDYISSPKEFYTSSNPLYLPGAPYPAETKRLRKPLFAFAIDSKLQRTDPETGKKSAVKLSQIENRPRTPLFLEQGLPGEKKANRQKKSDYDGSPKGNAKSLVGRHLGYGHILFVDGHIEKFEPDELLTETGDFFYPYDRGGLGLIWGRSAQEDPNK